MLLAAIARNILMQPAKNDSNIRLVHILGNHNTVADSLSRYHTAPHLMHKVTEVCPVAHWQYPTLDMLDINWNVYVTLSPANFSHSIQKLKNCLNDIQNFMFINKLKLNPDKTEFILIGSKNNRFLTSPKNILGNQVLPAQSVKNLGMVR